MSTAKKSKHTPRMSLPEDQRRLPENWTMGSAAYVLNCTRITLHKYLNGTRYPQMRMMRKIEHIFGWPAGDQIRLIPLRGSDLTYGIVFRQVLTENGGRFEEEEPI